MKYIMSKLLILDNSTDLLYALKFFFERNGYNAKTLSRGCDLIPEVKSFNPDVVMLDVNVNGYDGKEICKMLRNDAETKQLGILITSASPAKLQDYKQYMADDFIEKPFDLDILEQKVRGMIAWLPTRNPAHNEFAYK